MFGFLAHQQLHLARDAAVKAEFARRGGLCLAHTVQFERLAASREVCTSFAAVLEAQAERLERLAGDQSLTGIRVCEAVDAMRPDADTCQACTVAARIAAAAMDHAAAALEAGMALSVICLPHLGRLAARLGLERRRALLRRQSELLRRLADDMRQFALKQDAARRFLVSQEKMAAGRRGLRALGGNPDAVTGYR